MTGNLLDRVAEIIHRYSMLARGDRLGVAVSGGADSVALLHLLHRLSGTLALRLTVLHVNHGLRGSESDGDQAFVHSLAESLGWPCVSERIAPGSGNLEEAAREARRAFFLASTGGLGLRRVALGHTRSDQAETVLFRLLRGAGVAGAAAMRPVSAEGFIRPLLNTTRAEIRNWAREEGIAWREDASNEDEGFRRNRLRKVTLPELTLAYNPQLEQALAATASLAQAEEDYWSEEMERLYPRFARRHRLGIALDLNAFSDLHLAVQRRLLRRALAELRGGLRGVDFDHIEGILALGRSFEGHDRVLVPGVDAIRSFDILLLTRPGSLNAGARHYRVAVPLGEERELPAGAGHIYIRRMNPGSDLYDNFKGDRGSVQTAELTATALTGPGVLTVRNWEPGDRLWQQGHSSAVKVKLLFQEHRVKLWERRHWPVVVCGEEIAWIRDFGASEPYVAPDNCSERIQILYRTVE